MTTSIYTLRVPFKSDDSVRVLQQAFGIGAVGIMPDHVTLNVVTSNVGKARTKVFEGWCDNTKKHFPCSLRELELIGIV